MEKLRIGLVGCGRIAKNHIQAIANNQNMLELTAVSDIVPERMDAAVGLYSQGKGFKPRQFRDYQDLLAGEVDAVAIATESGNHAAIALDSLAAGKHLVVEKPLALSTDHSCYDYEMIVKHSTRILDTRNGTQGHDSEKITKL